MNRRQYLENLTIAGVGMILISIIFLPQEGNITTIQNMAAMYMYGLGLGLYGTGIGQLTQKKVK